MLLRLFVGGEKFFCRKGGGLSLLRFESDLKVEGLVKDSGAVGIHFVHPSCAPAGAQQIQ